MASNHYINNKSMQQALLDYSRECEAAEAADADIPQVPEYLAVCFMDIAERYSLKANFRNYPFREEMVMDGVENCIRYIRSYKPEKYDNPLAYFTQTIKNAFFRRIDVEKRNLYATYKAIGQSMIVDRLAAEGEFSTEESIGSVLNTDYMNEFMTDYEEKIAERRAKRAAMAKEARGVERFCDDGDDSEDSDTD